MGHSRSTATNRAIAESLSTIEFDAGSGSFQAAYDSDRDSTSLAVVAVVATVLDREPNSLTPLQHVVDTDALDRLPTESSADLGDSTSFRYDGFEITVTSEEVIEANPLENT